MLEKVINELDDVLTINKLQERNAGQDLFYGISNDNENLPHKILKRLQTSFEVLKSHGTKIAMMKYFINSKLAKIQFNCN